MAEGEAAGISIWLVPEGEAEERFGRLIDELSRRWGTPAFPPHVTLLAGLPDDEAAAAGGLRDLARDIPPFPVRLAGVDGRDEYFRRLFVRAEPTPDLLAAHARAATRFGRTPDPGFLPHLSLLYGRLSGDEVAALRSSLAGRAAGMFEAAHLHAWRTEGPVPAWRPLSSARLGA